MDIEQLLQQPAGKQLEFRRDLSSLEPLLKTLVAFANSAGGQLIIGVSDDGEIVGVNNPLDEGERLCSLIADSIIPQQLDPSIKLATVNNKTLLIVEVHLSNIGPHWLRAQGIKQGVMVRLGASVRPAGVELIYELKRSARRQYFDELPMPDLSVDDLDIAAAQQLFGSSKELNEQALLSLKLLTQHQGKRVPTHGGILLFGKQRTFHFNDAWIQCKRFRGEGDKMYMFDQTEIHDHLPQAVDSIELFLKKHAFKSAVFGGMRRIDRWSIPLEILREVIINALVHADYSQRGKPMRVTFYDDRIEIENAGLLQPGMTTESMKRGTSRVRNPVIARVFNELGLIEQWGSGIKRIFAEAAEQKLPEPYIEEVEYRLRFTVPLRNNIRITLGEAVRVRERLESPTKSMPESRLESELVIRILKSLAEQPLGKADIAEAVGHKGVSGQLNKRVKQLQEQGLIEMTRPEKPNSRLQKYRLTEQGRQGLKASL